MQGKVPVLETVQFGFKHLQATAQSSALAAALTAAPVAVCLWGAERNAGNVGVTLLISLLTALLQMPFAAAHYRVSARNEPLRMGFGRDELNLIGASVALGFFNLIVILIGAVLTGILLGVLLNVVGVQMPQTQQPSPEQMLAALGVKGMVATGLACLPLLLGLLWVWTRLALVGAATIGEGRILVFETWAWTKGNALRLLGAIALLALPLGLAAELVKLVAPRLAGGESAPAFLAIPALYVGAFASLFLVTGPLAGQAGYFYRGLKP